jgi:hypothetical protein
MAAITVVLVAAAVLLHFAKQDKDKGRDVYERVMAVVLCLAAFGAVVALAPLIASVWEVTGNGPGLVALVVVLMVSGYLTWRMALRGKRHHVAGTTATSIGFGLAAALVIGGWKGLTHSTGQALSHAGSATGQLIGGQALSGGGPAAARGHAAAARVSASATPEGKWALALAAVILIALVIVFVRSHKRSGASGGRGRGGARAGRGSGSGGRAISQGFDAE